MRHLDVSALFVDNVALRTEGVDRNKASCPKDAWVYRSPSARRAWIKIRPRARRTPGSTGRPPHGERGEKSYLDSLVITYGSHPLYKVRMRSLYGGVILLIVTQRSVQLFRASISSHKLQNPECESVRDFYLFTIHFSLFTDFALPARDF